MKPILLVAKAIQAIENAATSKIGSRYKNYAYENLGYDAGPWAIAFLASHRWMADGAKVIYRRVESRVKSLTVRESEDGIDELEVEDDDMPPRRPLDFSGKLPVSTLIRPGGFRPIGALDDEERWK